MALKDEAPKPAEKWRITDRAARIEAIAARIAAARIGHWQVCIPPEDRSRSAEMVASWVKWAVLVVDAIDALEQE